MLASSSIGVMVACLMAAMVLADDHTHQYEKGEEVTIWLNKVGPYNNPQELYSYYSLPFCEPTGKTKKHKSDSLGVVIEGSDVIDSGLAIHFQDPQPMSGVCELTLTEQSATTFREAIKNHYWYQMYIDELPVWGMVGEYMSADVEGSETQEAFLYTHKAFSISYNGNQIIEVNLTSENPQSVTAGETLKFTLSVEWSPTDKTFDRRFDRYLDFDFFEHNIHWFSILNSFMMVIFLCGVVALILMRTLKNDYATYSHEDQDMEDRLSDETGWKLVHRDVFRPPRHLILFAALTGTGYQLSVLAFAVIILTLAGSFYDERGTIVSLALGCYSLTSFLAGFSSARIYKTYNGQHWQRCMVMTGVGFPAFCVALLSMLGMISLAYQADASFGFMAWLKIMLIWFCVSGPLIVLGTVVGRSTTAVSDAALRPGAPRPLPTPMWYSQPWIMSLLTGVLPFGSIFIEIYFVFTSFWNYKFYHVYEFMLLVYCMLIVVTVCVTIVSTYFLLNQEDYRWQWNAIFSGGSTALYVYAYSIYYFFTKTNMSGFLQTFFYFTHMAIACVAIFVLTGTIGFVGSNIFVRRIYQYIKTD